MRIRRSNHFSSLNNLVSSSDMSIPSYDSNLGFDFLIRASGFGAHKVMKRFKERYDHTRFYNTVAGLAVLCPRLVPV